MTEIVQVYGIREVKSRCNEFRFQLGTISLNFLMLVDQVKML